jgi:DNA invertase Pin-like site-specific DNA recombinase
MQCKMVGYHRVSTDSQGKSGLGLEAQQAAVREHVERHGCKLIASYTEIETGKKDSLDNRPELRKAIAHAKQSGATLVVAKLDRLTRSVAVLSMLQSSGIDFVACDNPYANRLTIQILAAVAEDEVRRISERTRAALAAYKARGGRLGAALQSCRNLTPEARKIGAKNAGAAARAKADEAYSDIADDLRTLRARGMPFRAIADELNERGHTTRRGKPWNAMQVRRVLERA